MVNFWRTLGMPSNNCEISFILTCLGNCVITNLTGAGTFAITYTKFYVLVVTLSTQDNTKLLQEWKLRF